MNDQAAIRLYSKALEIDPKLLDQPTNWHRYNLACSAAREGCRADKDGQEANKEAKREHRRLALMSLDADLAIWARPALSATAKDRALVKKTMLHWKSDADLVGIRDEKELAKLPEEEHTAFQKLWSNVDELLEKTETP